MASTFKLPLAAAMLAEAERARWRSTRSRFTRADLLANSPVIEAQSGAGRLPVERLCAAIVEVSDNSAANLLLAPDRRAGGADPLHAARCGDPVTRLDRYEMELNANLPGDPRDTTSPAAMAGLMRDAACSATCCSPASRAGSLGWMVAQPHRPAPPPRRLPGRLAGRRQDRQRRQRRAFQRPRHRLMLAAGRPPDPDRLLPERRRCRSPSVAQRPATPRSRALVAAAFALSDLPKRRSRRHMAPRESGGRRSRQPGQVRKEAAVTSSSAGSFRLPPCQLNSLQRHVRAEPDVDRIGDAGVRAGAGVPVGVWKPAMPRCAAVHSTGISSERLRVRVHGDPDSPEASDDLGPRPRPRRAAAARQRFPQPYRVLARKYRPQSFDELIGQEAMVQTLANAIERDRLAHAFLLTGVRGVGKTSTARLIAKALNCIGPDGQGGPTIEPCGVCEPCRAIAEGRHIDVIEMDAASHTGVDDVREIIEAVRYAAVSARYKVYIVDEVHMLSKNAFNALLKTLEEPPAHVKFLFATTEVNKVPVTVLSRCQRFDLRRIPAEQLAAHFGEVARSEGVEVEPEALALIARAAEGSARDGLSILDQAIAHGAGGVTAEQVRAMLGLSDRGAIRAPARPAARPATRRARWPRCATNMISASSPRR